MLETIREYALNLLAELGEESELRTLHAEFYMALAEVAELKLTQKEQAEWFEQLESQHDNLRAALDWYRDSPGGAESGLRLVGALFWFWQVRGYLREGRERLDAALNRAEGGYTEAHAKALWSAGTLALFQGDYTAAGDYFSKSLDIERARGNLWGATLALNGMGRVAKFHEEYSIAYDYYKEALEIRTNLGNKWGLGGSHNNLGELALYRGDAEGAKAHLQEALGFFRELSDVSSIAMVLSNLGIVALSERDYAQAVGNFTESLTLEIEVGYKWGVPYCLVGLAEVARATCNYGRAACLLGASEAMLETLGAHMGSYDRAGFERNVVATREVLPTASFQKAWQEGYTMTLEQAVAYSLDGAAVAPV